MSRLCLRDKTGTGTCYQQVSVYMHYLWKAGCRTPEPVVTFAFPFVLGYNINMYSIPILKGC